MKSFLDTLVEVVILQGQAALWIVPITVAILLILFFFVG